MWNNMDYLRCSLDWPRISIHVYVCNKLMYSDYCVYGKPCGGNAVSSTHRAMVTDYSIVPPSCVLIICALREGGREKGREGGREGGRKGGRKSCAADSAITRGVVAHGAMCSTLVQQCSAV